MSVFANQLAPEQSVGSNVYILIKVPPGYCSIICYSPIQKQFSMIDMTEAPQYSHHCCSVG